MLEARTIRVSFGGFQALDGASIRLPAGVVTGIIGPNGAGKSTLFGVLAGAVEPVSGEVLLEERPITRHNPVWRARHGLTRTFQLSRELAGLSVLENVLLARPKATGEGVFGALFARKAMQTAEEAAIEKARGLLARVDLWRLANAPAGALSGGQKKLLELCRALMLEPRIVLLDEPSAGVNPTRIGEITEFIQTLQREGMSFGMVEHNMGMIRSLCERVYVLAEGRVLTEGRFDEVVDNPHVASAYLGGRP